MNPIERAAAHPTSLRAAINAKCWDCQGRDQDPGAKARVRECTVKKCPLWPVRGWQSTASDGGEE